MTTINKIQIIIFVILILSSCAKPIDFKVSNDEKKIVLNGLIRPDSLIKVNLSKSIGVLELEGVVEFIEDANVKLYEDNNYIEDLTYIENGYYISSKYPELGKEYKVSANYQELSDAIGTTSLTTPIPISNLEYSYDSTMYTEIVLNPETGTYEEVEFYFIDQINTTLTFDDPPIENNYYFLTFTTLVDIFEYYPPDYEEVYIGTEMQSVWYDIGNMSWDKYFQLNNESGYVISDELFNGNTHTISANIDLYSNLVENKIYVNLYSIKKEFYQFAVSLTKYQEALYNPLTEPVNIISNIEGGYGFFSGYSVSQDSMVFEIE